MRLVFTRRIDAASRVFTHYLQTDTHPAVYFADFADGDAYAGQSSIARQAQAIAGRIGIIIIATLIDIVLLAFLAMTALAVARLHDLFAVVMLFGIYSLLSAGLYVSLDAVDVAFTEAAVGAGLSTVLMLTTLAVTDRYENPARYNPSLGLLAATITGAAFVFGTIDIPHFGAPNAPIHQHVAPHYIDKTLEEVGVPNIVTAVLASYRGYDTLGETTVIFTAGIGVLALLSMLERQREDGNILPTPLGRHIVLHVVGKLIIPLIMLFALYVQFHGDYSPGGGFQAGVILATAIILYAMVFGLAAAKAVISPNVLRWLMAAGVILFAGVGVTGLFAGGNYLDYGVLMHDPLHGQHLGIMLVELGVGITVTAVMVTIFFTFAGQSGAE
jgi:multicomponent Na+:H+ antiporter subunit B